MQKNKFLESAEDHLKQLDIPIGARSRLISEIEEAVDFDPSILDKDPISFTNRLLLEKNIEIPRKKASGFSIFLKFVFASFLLFVILLGVAYYKFSPLVKITDDRIILLGGLVDIDADGTLKVDSHYESNLGDQQVFKGSSNTLDKLSINANNAQVKLSCSNNTAFAWNCKSTKAVTKNLIEDNGKELAFNMKNVKAIECQFNIPHKKEFELDANNINIAIDRACFNVDIDADNGSVIIYENPELDYTYDLEVDQGFIHDFKSVKEAIHKIKIEIDNGTINKKL